MTSTEFRTWLEQEAAQFPTKKAAADAWGISPQYLNEILRGRREPGEKFLKGVGWRRVTTYEKVSK